VLSGKYPAMNAIGAHAVRVVFVISDGVAEQSKVCTSCYSLVDVAGSEEDNFPLAVTEILCNRNFAQQVIFLASSRVQYVQ